MKEAFLKTDEDLRAGQSSAWGKSKPRSDDRVDPTFLNDPSGCTAVVGVVTGDGRVIVVSQAASHRRNELMISRRPMLGTRDLC